MASLHSPFHVPEHPGGIPPALETLNHEVNSRFFRPMRRRRESRCRLKSIRIGGDTLLRNRTFARLDGYAARFRRSRQPDHDSGCSDHRSGTVGSPDFFVFGGGPYVAAEHPNGSPIGSANPGEAATLHANGFGTASAPLVGGSPAQEGPLSTLPVIGIGGIATTVHAGLVFPGEFQFNAIMPASLANGNRPATATYRAPGTQTGTPVTEHQ